MDGLLPASGSASRMRGIPKFLLPCDIDYLTLLERHVSNMLEYCEKVWIATRPELVFLIESLIINTDRVAVQPMTTNTMTETVTKLVSYSTAKSFMLCMPDTYFEGDLPYQELANSTSDLELACWRIREEQKGKLGQVQFGTGHEVSKIIDSRDKDANCNFDFSWGAMAFRRELLLLASLEMPHTGYLISPAIQNRLDVNGFIVNGQYFDCGTPIEYLTMLKKVTTI